MLEKTYDVITMGRSGLDLYSNDVGAPFVDIKSFAAYVGGSPTNIAVGARRLGLEVALLTAVGPDPVGDFILKFLDDEGVDTSFIPRKAGTRSAAVVLGIEPPDKFPLVFYRDNAADIQIDIDDVLKLPPVTRIFEFAGTNLSREPSRSATLFAAERARRGGATVILDLDFRPDLWHDVRAFGLAIRSVLRTVDVVLGTEDEINAALLSDPSQIEMQASQVSDARVAGDTARAIQTLLALGPATLVEKRGAQGARVHSVGRQSVDAPGFPVDIYNILGAGDAFAAGLIYGIVNKWDWYRAARMGNACGAIVVTKHGCANFMPTLDEVMDFASRHGGL
jgi:5-dehydro-2-deoxygluconokinase